VVVVVVVVADGSTAAREGLKTLHYGDLNVSDHYRKSHPSITRPRDISVESREVYIQLHTAK